jgi:hypothetical protein
MLSALGHHIVLADGTDVKDIGLIDPLPTLVDVILDGLVAYTGLHVAHVIIAALHALPALDRRLPAELRRKLDMSQLLKAIYAGVWFAAFLFLGSRKPKLFDWTYFFQLIGLGALRVVCALIGNHGCNPGSKGLVSRFRMLMFYLERVYVLLPTARPAMLGSHHMVQPLQRRIVYVRKWQHK